MDISPPCLQYVSVILVPLRPTKISQYKFMLNHVEIFGMTQAMKTAYMFYKNKLLDRISRSDYSVEKIARNKKLSIIKTQSLASEDMLTKIRSLSLDVILSVASSRIFGPSILSIPTHGCINVHAGLLPRYRGVNPSFWSLLNEEKQSAVTVHYMNRDIDDGEIIQQDTFSIEGVKSLHSVYLRIVELAPKTIIKSLVSIENGTVKTMLNERSMSSYFSFPTKEDGRRFREMGLVYW